MNGQRGLVQRIERKLEATVGDAFARVFGGSVVPQEVDALLRREAADGVRSLPGNLFLAPNEYLITLGVDDYQKVSADPNITPDAFAKHLARYIGEQGWQTYGDVVVRFEQSPSLHTGQLRVRGAVNPDAQPRSTVSDSAPQQSDHAFIAEPGVPPMTENSSYRGTPGQGRPGDDYYDDRYERPQGDPRGSQDPRGGQDPRATYPPEHPGYPPQPGYPPPGRPDQGGYPDQRGGYPDHGRYPEPGGYPDQGPESYAPPSAPPYEQRPPAGYGGSQGYESGYRQGGGYGPPGGQPGYGDYSDYGRGPARQDDGPGYGPSEQRSPYPEQGSGYPEQRGYPDQRGGYPDQAGAYPDQGSGYPDQGGYPDQRGGYSDQGYQPDPSYGRQDYGQPDYNRYADAAAGGAYAPPGSGYAEPAGRDYDYGSQPAPSGYDYGRGGYPPSGATVTLQLDDGSGRTYQLREGANVVGRGQDAQFRLPDTGVSRRHLEIRWDGQVALLSDLNSTNGTTVNNAPVQEWQLADGDVIRLGHSEIIVRIH